MVREEFIKGVLEVSEAGEWTVLVSSHDIEEVERLADRIALIEAGRLRLHETTEALQGRYRRLEVTLGDGEAQLATPPASWQEIERSGRVVRFIESRYERGATEQACRERFADAAVTARAMSLREIFISLARAGRAAAKEMVS
jgi:ABC-2 type transport system ATP-binding protein